MNDRPAVRVLGPALTLTAALALAGCSVGTLGGILGSDPADVPPPATDSTQTSGAPAVEMAGRWVLAAQGTGSCRMNFSGPPGSREGTIAPEGGCPGRFFTSRRWAVEQNTVVLRNHAGETLAQLNVAEPSRLEGQAVNGERVSLRR